MASITQKSRQQLSLAIALALGAATSHAVTITVTDPGDAGTNSTCTLRQAVESANNDGNGGTSTCTDGSSADTIVFDAGLSPSTVTLGGSALSVTSAVTIDGGTGGWDIRANEQQPYTGGTASLSRVFNVNAGTLALKNIHASFGYGLDGACIIANNGSSIALVNSSVSSCFTRYTAGSGNGGAIALYGSQLTIDHSTVGTSIAGYTGGVIAATGSDVIAIASTIRSGTGFYFGVGGILSLSGGSSLTLIDSDVDNGFARKGALIDLNASSMTAVNSTVEGGYARGGDSITGYFGYCGAINADASSVLLINTTVTGNKAYTYGGGICANFGSTVTLHNSIVSNNSVGSSGSGPDIYASTYSTASTINASYSLLGTTLQSAYSGNGNVFSDAPGLGSLTNNGGPTRTMALNSDSPAIGAGSVALAVYNSYALSYDQRGIGFPRTLSGSVDIGAFQHQPDPGDRIFVGKFDPEP